MDVVLFGSSWRKARHFTEVGDGRWLVMRPGRFQSVHLLSICDSSNHSVKQLFGASALAKDLMGITDYHKATFSQNFVASCAGAVASITVAAPLDVVKTRIQNANFENKVSGVAVVKDLLRNEGVLGLFKGLTPKVRLNTLHFQ